MVSGRTRHPLNRLPPLHDVYRRCYRQLGVRGSAIVALAIIDGVALEDIDRHHRWPKGTALRVLCAALDDYGWGLGRRWWLM